MLVFGSVLVFAWIFTNLYLVVCMYRKHPALGILGFLLPFVPFLWVLKWYSGNRKRIGVVLYSTALLGSSIIGYLWHDASRKLEPFFNAALDRNIPLALRAIAPRGLNSYSYIVVASDYHHQPQTESVDLLDFIRIEEVEELSKFYPINLKAGTIIELVIPIQSESAAVFEITSPGQIGRTHISSVEDILD